MSENLLGIENLKKAVKFGIDLAKQIEVSGKDGFNWTDSFSFFDELIQIPGLVSNGNAILAEFKDLSSEERTELLTYFKAEFDLENDKLENTVEKALETVISILGLLSLLKKTEVVSPITE